MPGQLGGDGINAGVKVESPVVTDPKVRFSEACRSSGLKLLDECRKIMFDTGSRPLTGRPEAARIFRVSIHAFIVQQQTVTVRDLKCIFGSVATGPPSRPCGPRPEM